MSSKISNISPEKRNDVIKIKQYKDEIKKLEQQINMYRITNDANKILEARNKIDRYENELKTLIQKYGKKYETTSEKEEKMLAEIEKEAAQPKQSKVMQLFKEQAKRKQIEEEAEAERNRIADSEVVAKEQKSDLSEAQKKRIRQKKAKEAFYETEEGKQQLAAAQNIKEMKKSEANYEKQQKELEEQRTKEIAEKVKVLKEAIKPELEYCGPALVDPKDNFTLACNVLRIKDPNFIQRPDASIILKNAYDDITKVCDTGKSKYNKKDYKTNIDKAYAFLNSILERNKQEQDEAIREASNQQKIREEEEAQANANRIITEKKAAEKKRLDALNAEILRAEQNVEKLTKDAQDNATRMIIEKKAAEKKRLEELKAEILRAEQNVEKLRKEEERKTLESVRAAVKQQEIASKRQAEETKRKAEANKKQEGKITEDINRLNLSNSNTLQEKQKLLKALRALRGNQPLDYRFNSCKDEPSSLVGIDSPNYNNCYLNALFQMLFHMCYFRRAILDNIAFDFSPAINELADILYRYQQLYNQGRYELLFLTDIDYFSIKQGAGLDPLADEQQDPMEILSTNFFEGTGGIANNLIYNNPNNPNLSQYVYQLIDDDEQGTNLQELIIAQDPNFFNSIEPNTNKKYIILNYPRFKEDGTKKQNAVDANPTISINELVFILKGIIVHFGENTDSGHYVYVTFKNDGQEIDKIYNNLLVTDFVSKDSVEGQTNEDLEKVLEKIKNNFNGLITNFIKTFVNEPEKQDALRNIQSDVIQNKYLLGFTERTLNEEFETFKKLFNEGQNLDANFFKRDVNTIDFDNLKDTINRNGAIFLYENMASRLQPVIPIAAVPQSVTPTAAVTPQFSDKDKLELQNATKAAMSLFEIPFNKTFFQIITNKELTIKRDKLLQKIENNVTILPDELKQIVNNAYIYLSAILDKIGNKIIGRALNHLPLELLDNFYTTLKPGDKNLLLTLSRKFVGPYKGLNYNRSIIIQRPKINETRKISIQKAICKELGELNPLINSQRGIPTPFRKLTRKITREEIYKPIKARIAKKEAETKKVEEKKTNETKNKIETIEKEAKELQNQKILKRIEVLSQEIDELKRKNPDQVLESDLRFMDKKLREINNLKKRLQSGEDSLNKSKKGGTNKIKEQNKKGTRRTNR